MSGLEIPIVHASGLLSGVSPDALIQAGATLVVGLAQFVLIWAGLRQMNKASVDRNRQLDVQGETLKAQSDALAMLVRGLEAVIDSSAPGKSRA